MINQASNPAIAAMDEKIDSQWDKEEFEELVSAALISMFETKLHKKAKGLHPIAQMKPSDIVEMRKLGPYFPPADRLVNIEQIDLLNDGLPSRAIWASKNGWIGDWYGTNPYLLINHVQRVNRLPPEISFIAGVPYLLRWLLPSDKGLFGLKRYAVVCPDGTTKTPRHLERIEDREYQEERKQDAMVLAGTIQFWQDRRYLWNVCATEKTARAMFGVYQDEIQSLFYSREAPRSETGRKRPILHWVRSHRRRLREGIEIDVREHLRGTASFEMDGTTFEITRPIKNMTE